jgi:hypothetical protein
MHYLNPDQKNAHVLLLYRNFLSKQQCHIGLGVNATHTAKVLRQNRIRCDIGDVWDVREIRAALDARPTITHALLEAPWVDGWNMRALCIDYPNVHFLVRTHSQIGFLQVEAGAVTIIRELLILQDHLLNLTVVANNQRLAQFLTETYGAPCLYLPNLYDDERAHRRRHRGPHAHRQLRVGSFGALRLLKNHSSSAAAALMIAERRGCDLEFWISVNREENIGAHGIVQTLRNMFSGLRWARLVESPWEDWGQFRRTVAHMDLCLQPSFTETFNITTADAVAEGVPAVVSSAIDWLPRHWQAEPDFVEDIARVGANLLSNPHAADEGYAALERFSRDGVQLWLTYLNRDPRNSLACISSARGM